MPKLPQHIQTSCFSVNSSLLETIRTVECKPSSASSSVSSYSSSSSSSSMPSSLRILMLSGASLVEEGAVRFDVESGSYWEKEKFVAKIVKRKLHLFTQIVLIWCFEFFSTKLESTSNPYWFQNKSFYLVYFSWFFLFSTQKNLLV